MQPEFCPQESKILEALKEGPLPARWNEHIASCKECAEAVMVTTFLAGGPQDDAPMTVPPVGLLYWKAELRAKRERAEEALLPARRMEVAATVAIAAMGVAGAAMYGSLWAPIVAGSFTLAAAGAWWAVRHWLVRGQAA